MAFFLWVATTLLFMAAMSIGLAIFALTAIFVLYRDRASWLPNFTPWLRTNFFFRISILYILWGLLTLAIAGIFPPLGVPLGAVSELRKIQYFFLPFLVAATLAFFDIKKEPFSRGLERVFLVFAILASCAAVLQFWGRWLFPEEFLTSNRFFRTMTYAPYFHAQGFMQFHLSFATVMFFPLCYVLASSLWGQKSRILYGLLAAFFALAIFYTYSRVAWVALLCLPPVCIGLWRPKGFLVSLPVVVTLAVVIGSTSESVRARFLDSTGMDGRWIVWRSSLEMIKDRPLTGVGWGKSGDFSRAYSLKATGEEPWLVSHAHNNFLDVTASMGVPGLFLFLAWWGLLFLYAAKSFWADGQERIWGATFILAGISFLINGLTQVNFTDAKSQHMLALSAGVILFWEWRRSAIPRTER